MSGALTIPPVTTTFRDMSDTLSPTYLNGPNGKRYRYSMAVMFDAIADGAGYAVLARFPSRAPSDAFVWLEQDRQIDQGFAESQASIQARLAQWLDLWGFAGLPTGVMLAILGICLPVKPLIRTVDNAGQWNTYAAGTFPLAPPPASMPTPPVNTPANGVWRWDANAAPNDDSFFELWARMCVVLYSTSSSPWTPPSATYGGGARYGDGTCYGFSGTRSQAAQLTSEARKWRAGHVVIPFVIVSYDATMFDPTQPFGSSKLPDGNWGHWSKVVNGQYVPARPAATTCSFLDGGP